MRLHRALVDSKRRLLGSAGNVHVHYEVGQFITGLTLTACTLTTLHELVAASVLVEALKPRAVLTAGECTDRVAAFAPHLVSVKRFIQYVSE